MIAADRRLTIERADNGWVLDYWTRDRSTMTQRREVFTGYLLLLQRLGEVMGIDQPSRQPAANTGD